MLKGIAVSEGIAQGIAFCIDTDRNKENCEDSYRKAESKDEESARFQEAMTAFLKKQNVRHVILRSVACQKKREYYAVIWK